MLRLWESLKASEVNELGGYSRRGSNLLGSMMKDEEAMSNAVSSVEVIGEWLKHPHVVPATRFGSYKSGLSHVDKVLIRWHQRRIKKMPLECDWLVWSWDMLALAVKTRGATTMNLD
ncbi:hypothetical protein F2Q70_00026642 [Brassica cretica]|uniref:Uncharacterized protein n=1 Tax=Brassica cretica TaxID=69181 RepID=A0A8S9L9A6_BRACR|nr:hypothetical protein F2Q70_00026642 [Brassica cretica]